MKQSFAKLFFRVIGIQFKAVPIHCITINLFGLCLAASMSGEIMATQGLFDAITEASAGRLDFFGCLAPLAVLSAVFLGEQLVNGIVNFQAKTIANKSAGRTKLLLQRKLQRIDPAAFEKTDFLDDVNKATEGAVAISGFCTTSFFVITVYGAYMAFIGAYLFSLKPVLFATILISFFPAIAAQIVQIRVFTKLEEQSAPLRRENDYYKNILCSREYFKETRILGAYKFFRRLFDGTLTLLTRKEWQAERKTALLKLTLNMVSFAGMAVSAYLLFTATMNGEVSVGAFAAVFSSLSAVFGMMEEILVYHFGWMNKQVGKIRNYVRLLDMPELAGADGVPDFSKGIAAERISFTYPGRDEPAVREVSLSISNGETIAVVGENGAGKSTLVRLLTGIYRPTSGRVIIGGLDTSKVKPSDIFQKTSGVFQKFQQYKMTLRENVAISDVSAAANDERVNGAIAEAGASLENISLSTMLSPEFDGLDLSGGQWQRLAIARGLYRVHGFIVLDEPTSAIDPVEETRVYSQFRRLAEGKCAIVVTHRLGSVKLANRIIVMDGGRIADMGTHEELLARPGKYAEMWAAQAGWYERV